MTMWADATVAAASSAWPWFAGSSPEPGNGNVAPAQSFRRDGMVFRQDDGKIFPWLFGTEFPLLRMKLDGKDLKPLLADRVAIGQRGCSIFLTSEIRGSELGDGGPYADQKILDALGPLADELRAAGFNTEACVFQAVSVTMRGTDRQKKFWNAVLEIAKARPWMTVSVSKEWWKQVGALDFNQLRQPSSQTWDGGGIADGLNVGVQIAPGIWVCPMRGTHDTFQAARNDEWPRKTKSAWDISTATLKGCVTCEPMGADETNQPGRRSNVPNDHFWSAANARLLSLGSYFHSQAGIDGALFGPVQRQCALAHYQALASIPCEAQLGRYVKAVGPWAQAIENYDELRTYAMLTSDVEQWIVVTRPGPNYPRNGSFIAPDMLNDWMIVDRLGPLGTIMRATR